ncbi:MAG: hypothetical protein K8R40_02275 [Anaerolineaceae bacterium]|nr:hypothetical protein [Anaerolineaceae bacterium]
MNPKMKEMVMVAVQMLAQVVEMMSEDMGDEDQTGQQQNAEDGGGGGGGGGIDPRIKPNPKPISLIQQGYSDPNSTIQKR